jgi:hypothetical protein
MWEASLENAKQPPFGICDIRSIWLQVPSFPRASAEAECSPPHVPP